MYKPTIFFSHSSSDKDIVCTIKKKLDSITGSVLDIFLSSDGQSIPFGSNWVHKIEDGLKRAAIMFVFVTPNSTASNWIYFEAGYAYSKDIEVIPVGIGIDIGLLKAPLSLLQGFNINSGDGLNNFVSIINKKFEYTFTESFTNEDFALIIDQNEQAETIDFNNIFHSAKIEFSAQNYNNGVITIFDVRGCFVNITDYLRSLPISFSFEESRSNLKKEILVYGLKIILHTRTIPDSSTPYNPNGVDKLEFSISTYNFEKSFTLFIHLMQLIEDKESSYIWFLLKPEYAYISIQEDMAALLSTSPELFSFSENNIGRFIFEKYGFRFGIFKNMDKQEVLSVVFNVWQVSYQNIKSFLFALMDKGIIYKL